MDNYYEECIAKVEGLIEEGNYDKARAILEDELDMPYVPQVHLNKFKELYYLIPQVNTQSNLYLDSIDEIERSLFLEQEQQLQAMLSLERLNLRPHLLELREWLLSFEVEVWIKQQILVFLLEQGIEEEFQVNFDGKLENIKIKDLTHPFKNGHYIRGVQQLKEKLEQKNPSFFELCMQELNYQVGDLFPFKHETVDADEIIERVNGYLNQ